jgi:uncharacterized protein with PIN domain
MLTARFTFLPDLNIFLIPERREGDFWYAFESGQSIKHLIEAAGVPHTEIGQVVVNGQPVSFDYQVQDGDQVTVSPAAAENSLPGEARFVLDNHLGRLTAYLRMLGFDGLYRNDFDDEELAQIAADEKRILLTRDRRLLMRKMVQRGYCLRSLDSREQTIEVLRRFDLFQAITPFQRCLRCNTPLERVGKEAILDHLEPLTRKYYEEFHRCPACGQIYWKGSHYEHMQRMVEKYQARQGPEN